MDKSKKKFFTTEFQLILPYKFLNTMKTRITLQDYIKANRKASREAEIEAHNRVVPKHKVHRSKKTYDRKQFKAGSNDLPFSFKLKKMEKRIAALFQ